MIFESRNQALRMLHDAHSAGPVPEANEELACIFFDENDLDKHGTDTQKRPCSETLEGYASSPRVKLYFMFLIRLKE